MLDAEQGRHQAAGQRSDRVGRRLAVAWGLAFLALAVIALWFIYLHVSRTQRVESDGASNALQAWDMLHGNLLLRGWTVTDVSFYTTELPEYLLIEAVRGLNADVLHVAAALSYALLVPLAAILARGRATGRDGLLRMLIAGGLLIAPQPGAGVFIVLFQPDHMGTQVPLLATWLVLDRYAVAHGSAASGRRWQVPVAVGLMLTWIGIADKIVWLTGVAPLVLVCAIRAWKARTANPWSEIWLAVAALASVGVADLAVRIIHAAGGFTVLPVSIGATFGKLPHTARLTVDGVLGLYGASFQGHPHGFALLFAVLHLAGVVLAIAGLLLALRRFLSGDDRIAQVLAVSILVNVAAYLVSIRSIGYWSVREMAGVLPAGAVLAGRMLGPVLAGAVADAARWRRQAARTLSAILALVLAGYLAALGYAATSPSAPGVGQELQAWLKDQGLRYGLAGYGVASATTMASGAAVAVRPVILAPDGRLIPGPYEYDATWYDPRSHDATFVVLLTSPSAMDRMSPQQIAAMFGPPAHTYTLPGYQVLTWHKNLLSDLGPPCPEVGARLLGKTGPLAPGSCAAP